MILIGSFSLMAMPFLSGYYSKDLIIESAYGQYLFSGFVVYWLATISAVFTSLYSIKLIFFTFLGSPNATMSRFKNVHEPSLVIGIPLLILGIMSIGFWLSFKRSLSRIRFPCFIS
ncbi:NADH dehydrogenase subunit 5 (mitochondrion) [Neolecta irregularis DAH-3]|uniref:NADH dehydrogenase subunit 5 n=1 Tax=Neolecta irregularis (strain DAH-3) TaxID=1198029 RepID=A0A1U7LG24_NEOID|nr:NADH dehydrogenase subunit 5 [Neolecta irregularis DAH-3]|eukprot:OLL21605.1 NADH dehydrogenase subunit 5 (mitochondrion) [Neolecta irregularis DAH-3]